MTKQSPHLCNDGLIIDSGPSKQSFLKNGCQLLAVCRRWSAAYISVANKESGIGGCPINTRCNV